MKKLLIISYDIIQENEPRKSYSIASITGYLKSKPEYNKEYLFEHLSINIKNVKNLTHKEIFNKYFMDVEFKNFDFIAISTYVWSAQYINPLIQQIRKSARKSKIILGGNEISYSTNEELKHNYPDANVFIKSYAEDALFQIITGKSENKIFFKSNNTNEIYKPLYSSNEIKIEKNNIKVRFETKRGCLFNCSFCAHKEKNNKKVEELNFEKIICELKFLNNPKIVKVNILDPVFNTGHYLDVLEEMVKMNFKPKVSLQVRFELINGIKGKYFLDLCEKLDVVLEFGLQTIIEEEYKVIKRNNNKDKIEEILKDLQKRNIDYETSLIYGLPNQTVSSFQESINFLKKNGSKKITAFPLMLLKGTELYHRKDEWSLKEKEIGLYNLPYVISGNSFSEKEYYIMEQIANNLN